MRLEAELENVKMFEERWEWKVSICFEKRILFRTTAASKDLPLKLDTTSATRPFADFKQRTVSDLYHRSISIRGTAFYAQGIAPSLLIKLVATAHFLRLASIYRIYKYTSAVHVGTQTKHAGLICLRDSTLNMLTPMFGTARA